MSRVTMLSVVVLGWALIGGPRLLAQPPVAIVVIDAAGQMRASFQPRRDPVANPADIIPPVAVSVNSPDARTPDGLTIVGIAFTGWNEGSGFRVVALAMLRPAGTRETAPQNMMDLPRRQFATFTMALGESRAIEEMKSFGLQPIVLRAELRAVPVAAVPAAAPPASLRRSRDMPFTMHMVDPGYCESVAVSDFNNDGKLDILSGEYWFEAPSWTPHKVRDIGFTSGYMDNFSDLPADIDGDGYVDIIQIAYFARRIVWLKNPGKSANAWTETQIDSIGPTEFAFLVDLNNDGKAVELLPQFTTAAGAPLVWYELQDRKWTKHAVSAQSHGHGIGAGDLNGDGRNDILTAKGWLEAPADPRAPGEWTFHATDWGQRGIAEFGYMHVLDVNQDGRRDVVTTMAHSNGVLWIEQAADGAWASHTIDETWSQAHTSALVDFNGDGQPDLVTGKRYHARNAAQDPSEREPLGLYWYEFRRAPASQATPDSPARPSPVTWIRHIIDYGGRAGTGLQMVAIDMDRDGDIDLVTGGKTGVFLAENLTRR